MPPLNPAIHESDPLDPIARFRVRSTLVLLPFAAIILMASWGIMRGSGTISVADLYGLPIISSMAMILTSMLILEPKRLEFVQRSTLAVVALYLLIDLAFTFLPDTFRTGQLGQSAPWFPIVTILAFFTYTYRDAVRFGLVYSALALLIGVIAFRNGITSTQFNTMLHFYAGNATTIGLLWALGRLRTEYATMQHFANTDTLTGLTNRRSMQSHLERLGVGRKPFTVFMVDVDHFKRVNDTHGHALGDQVLRELAFTLANHVRTGDTICRWGGEEFLVLMRDVSPEGATRIGERLLEAVRTAHPGGQRVTISIGMASHDPDESLDATLQRADNALYQAKNNGRDRLEVLRGGSGTWEMGAAQAG